MQPTTGRRWLADSVMVLVALIWGGNNVVTKAALADWVSPLAYNAVRFPMGALALTVLMLLLEKDWRLPRALWWRVAALGLVGNALNQMLVITGISRTTASNAGIINAMIPVLVALFGAVTGLDRMTPRLWLGTAISFGGILLVTLTGRNGFGNVQAGDLLLLGSACTWTGYTLYASTLVKQTSPLKVTAYGMLLASVVLVIVAAPDLARQDYGAVSAASWSGVLYAGLLSNAAAYGMYVWVIQRIGSTRTALFNNLSPLVTAVAAWFFLGERWQGLQWVGATLVMFGVLTARWDAFSAGLRSKAA